MVIQLLVALGLMYLVIIHLAYFLFGAYFRFNYNVKIKYWSIYPLQFEMTKEIKS